MAISYKNYDRRPSFAGNGASSGNTNVPVANIRIPQGASIAEVDLNEMQETLQRQIGLYNHLIASIIGEKAIDGYGIFLTNGNLVKSGSDIAFDDDGKGKMIAFVLGKVFEMKPNFPVGSFQGDVWVEIYYDNLSNGVKDNNKTTTNNLIYENGYMGVYSSNKALVYGSGVVYDNAGYATSTEIDSTRKPSGSEGAEVSQRGVFSYRVFLGQPAGVKEGVAQTCINTEDAYNKRVLSNIDVYIKLGTITQAGEFRVAQGGHIYNLAKLAGSRSDTAVEILASAWNNKKQTVSCAAVKNFSSDYPIISLIPYSGTDLTNAEVEGYSMISGAKVDALSGTITFECFLDVPTVDLKVNVKAV